MDKFLSYKVILEPAEEGGYTAYVPSLPGCVSEGDSYEEVLKNIKEAIEGWIEVSREFGDEIPPSDVIIETVQVSACGRYSGIRVRSCDRAP
jgi:predicted RNase H-like HicB family nuclease